MSSKFETQLLVSRPYLTKKQLSKLQNSTIPDRRAYNQKKITIFKFLSDICVQLKFPRRTLETAIYFYQRFYVFNRFETELCHTVATSCLLLSCKQVETIKKANEICSISLRLRSANKITPEIIDGFKKRVLQIELRILEACAFDYRVNNMVHIDEYVVKIGKELNLEVLTCHLAWIIAYDVLKLELLLMVPQHIIAIAVLKTAYEILHGKIGWPKIRYTAFEADEKSVSQAYFDILNFYINSFTVSDLPDNLPEGVPPVSIDMFIGLKKNAGQEFGLEEITEKAMEADAYLTTPRDYSIRERRYVLSSQLVADEAKHLTTSKP
ncbi:hypothetical protein HG537_0E03970 [Torulaspora globosa]|uniref:Cyclin-like domain-containing protein n=1 Tax=Torulaspora globosa TaxID=48254 RepID=A0A7H9HXB4_9SACH|nr:hypothetical protein HG537_0E03970 [Torulaspora sp. CBS 2947]